MAEYTPRSAALLFSEAIEHIGRLEPSAARRPVRDMFRAEIERCALSPSLLGQSGAYVIELAEALVGRAQSESGMTDG
jgi:hypothetical protein